MTSLIYPGGTNNLTYTYDSMGNQNGMKDSVSNASASATFWPTGQMETLSFSNPNVSPGYSSQSFTYNNLWQLTGISANPALISMQYVYPAGHNNGRISQSIDGVLGQTVNYTYDSLNRLSTAQATNGAWGQSYSYDGFGNLTAKTVTAGSAQQFNAAYSAATNQQVGGWYDANGNSLYGPYDPNGYRYQYYYDVENRLVGVGSSDGSPGYGYGYDPQGKRVMVETALTGGTYPATNATFTLYGITGQRLTTFWVTWSQYSNSGYCNGATYCSGTLTNYLYLAGKRLAQPDGYAFLADRLGSQRENGQAYYPWGEPMGSAQTGDVEFATYWRDMVGQDYADQRYYNSNAGRFYTPDPLGLKSADLKNPITWNRYLYAAGDPVNANDPSGLTDVVIAGITDTQGANSIDDFAGQIGAITVFPFAGGSIPGGAASVLFGTLTSDAAAEAVAQAILAAAADQSGDINIFAFSGGANAFAAALQLLPADVISRINNVTYASPGAGGQLPLVNGKAPEVIYGTGLDDNLATLPTIFPAGTTIVHTTCGHDASCEFEQAGAASRAGTFCIQCAAFSAPDLSLALQWVLSIEAAAYSTVWGTSPPPNWSDPFGYLQLLLQPIEVVTSTVHF